MAAKSSIRRIPIVLWRSLGSTNTRRAAVLCAMFAAVMTAGLYFSGKSSRVAKQSAQQAAAPALGLGQDDPVVHFTETRVGHLLFASDHSDECRRLLFDNRSGAFYDANPIQCRHIISPQASAGGSDGGGNDRLMALRKAFTK
jgi:hypothetical protein